MPYVYKEVEIDVDLVDFSDEDLISELESRGQVIGTQMYGNPTAQLHQIADSIKLGQSYENKLSQYIYDVLGRIV